MRRVAFVAAATLALLATPAVADPGKFLQISDIHFNPFDPSLRAKGLAATDTEDWPGYFAADPDRTFSKYGEDTNAALLSSAIATITREGLNADFALLTGDLLVHRFQDNAESVLGYPQGSAESDAFAIRTTLFVAETLRAALPGMPIFLSLGNNDSGCGDYHIDPGGTYLAATRETARSLAGAELVAPDFDATYLAGGYYAARHPTVPKTTIVVLDDVMWSHLYENTCGSGGLDAANAMMTWLEQQLAAARTTGGKVWLTHHIPVGMDAYSSANSKETACTAKLVPMLAEPFASTYVRLLGEYADVITSSFTGHTHFDDYRLLRDTGGTVTGVEKIGPAISPIFGQNPGFLVYDYERSTGAIADFTAMYLTNLESAQRPASGVWQKEYSFAETYGQKDFSPASAEAMWRQLSAEGTADDTFRKLYNVSHGELTDKGLNAWICAIGFADAPGYTKCFCGG